MTITTEKPATERFPQTRQWGRHLGTLGESLSEADKRVIEICTAEQKTAFWTGYAEGVEEAGHLAAPKRANQALAAVLERSKA